MVKIRTIISEVPLNPVRVPTTQEVKELLEAYQPGNKYRLMFFIMAACGLRSGEVVSLQVSNFSKDFKKLTYRVQKPSRKKYKDLIRKIYKIRTVKVPGILQNELREFFSRNYYTFKDGKVFNVCQDSLRRELSKKRHALKGGFLDEYRLVTNGRNRCWYRITNHSFRRFYLTYQLYVNSFFDNTPTAIIKTSKEIGHTGELTTLCYLHDPRDIGIKDPSVLYSFEQLLGGACKRQTTLVEY